MPGLGRTNVRMQRSDFLLLGISVALMLVWNGVSWQFPFFWDNVLNSKIAHWYLESDFTSLVVPEGLDAGHPPFFSLYLALVWKAFGRSLTLAHVAMLPFLLLLLVQYQRLVRHWLSPQGRVWAMILLFCEPTFLSQASMVSPDIPLVAFYLLAINSMLDGRRGMAAVAMVAMAAMSFRGILMVVPLFATDVAVAWLQGKRRPEWRKAFIYLPVTLLTLGWLWLHLRVQGWLFAPPPETYGGHRETVGIGGIARNLGLVGWRFLDFGRVFVWLFVMGCGLFLGIKRVFSHPFLRQMAAIFLMTAGGLSLILIPFSNPIGHRYFLVCYLILLIIAVGLGEMGGWKWAHKLGLAAVMAGLLTGNLWIYPKGVAQGWDASLAHIPSFVMLQSERNSMAGNGIDYSEVCATFPFLANPYYAYVEDSIGPWFRDKDDLQTTPCKYILYSNMAPGFSDSEIAALESNHPQSEWRLYGGVTMWGIEIMLYVHDPPPQRDN